jgi:hypothetical protein
MKAAFALVVAATLIACKSSDPQQGAPIGSTTSSSSSTTGSGGSDGSGGSGGSGGTTSTHASSTSSTHASSTSSASSSSGGAKDVWSCNTNQGYWAVSTGFTSPTPEPLAEALNELGYDDDAHPISFVIKGGSTVTAALSATVTGGTGDTFPSGEEPAFAPLIATDGEGVTTTDAQPKAFLHFVDGAGPVDLEIDHLVFTASETFDCNSVFLDVQAVVPSSTYDIVLHLSGGDMTVGDLVGQQTVPAPQVHLTFSGQPMSFDFSSL